MVRIDPSCRWSEDPRGAGLAGRLVLDDRQGQIEASRRQNSQPQTPTGVSPMENQTLTEEVLARLRVVHVPDNKTNNGILDAWSFGDYNPVEPESDKIREIYEKYQAKMMFTFLTVRVGFLLGRYKSGKLPKAFKVIPTLKNWEKVLLMTSPENWTTNAVLEATRIFVSNLSPKMAQRFRWRVKI